MPAASILQENIETVPQKKTYNTRGTMRQKSLAREMVKNYRSKKPINKTKLLESVGYAHNTAVAKQEEIMTSKGVLKNLSTLGFNPDNAKRVVAQILESDETKDENKLRAADMIFDVHGEYKRTEAPQTVNIAIFNTEQQERIAQRIIETLKPQDADTA